MVGIISNAVFDTLRAKYDTHFFHCQYQVLQINKKPKTIAVKNELFIQLSKLQQQLLQLDI